MSTKMTFKEYYQSKQKLIEASDESPKVSTIYKLQKYCKVPVRESVDTGEKEYIAFKPKDKIEIFWEYSDLNYPTPRYVVLLSENNKKVYPCWDNKKMLKWVTNTTEET